MKNSETALAKAAGIKVVVFDVDGVLTDGKIYMGPQGEAMKAFSARDGMGITMLHKGGIATAIITGRESAIVANRAKELKIAKVWQGCQDKRQAWQELLDQLQVAPEEIAYMGDDLNDLPLLSLAGLPATVVDGVPEVQQIADFVSDFQGGAGAVRELAQFILQAQNKWEDLTKNFVGVATMEQVAQ